MNDDIITTKVKHHMLIEFKSDLDQIYHKIKLTGLRLWKSYSRFLSKCLKVAQLLLGDGVAMRSLMYH